MPAALTIQTPTRTIARDGKSVTSELKPGVSFTVGDVVSFGIGNTGSLIVHAQDAKRNTWAVYRGTQNWTVSADDTRIKSLVVEHRPIAGQQKAESLWVPVNVWAKDSDPLPTVPPVKEQLPAIGWGICGNELDGVDRFTAAFGKAKADGGAWARLWHSHFGKISEATARIIGNVHAAGGKVILCVQPKDGGVENFGTPDFARFVSINADVLNQCEYVEAGNELHCFGIDKYLPDDFGRNWHGPYVERWLKPLSKELRKIGVKTMLTSTTDVVTMEKYQPHAERLKAAGACDWCDAVATHVYAKPADFKHIAPVLNMLRDVYGKPVVITEAAPSKQAIRPKDFPAAFNAYAQEVRKGQPLAAVWYRGLVHPNAREWPAELSLIDSSGNPTASYVALMNAVKA